MQEQIELLSDIQISISQIENGEGIPHNHAKDLILKRLSK